ncbi:MAG: ATPase, partial [Deltaproteobacteria bacterium]|nr:ATPase [Deltaproteobacteria bacterium]
MKDLASLADTLHRIDGRGYRAYKELAGGYGCSDFELHIDHVQGDPFAAPSRLRVIVPHAVAELPADLRTPERRVAVADFVARAFAREAARIEQRRGSGKSGQIDIDAPGQEVLARTACQLTPDGVELRFTVGLPAAGRRVLGRQADRLLLDDLPALVRATARFASLDPLALRRHAECVEDAAALRQQITAAGLVAFVAEGALLPRRSGIDPRPLAAVDTIPFESPPELRASFDLPNGGTVTGMGIPQGVTLIVGGGYHGKSTLLEALEMGIYDHRPDDGRQLVVSHPATVPV